MLRSLEVVGRGCLVGTFCCGLRLSCGTYVSAYCECDFIRLVRGREAHFWLRDNSSAPIPSSLNISSRAAEKSRAIVLFEWSVRLDIGVLEAIIRLGSALGRSFVVHARHVDVGVRF